MGKYDINSYFTSEAPNETIYYTLRVQYLMKMNNYTKQGQHQGDSF